MAFVPVEEHVAEPGDGAGIGGGEGVAAGDGPIAEVFVVAAGGLPLGIEGGVGGNDLTPMQAKLEFPVIFHGGQHQGPLVMGVGLAQAAGLFPALLGKIVQVGRQFRLPQHGLAVVIQGLFLDLVPRDLPEKVDQGAQHHDGQGDQGGMAPIRAPRQGDEQHNGIMSCFPVQGNGPGPKGPGKTGKRLRKGPAGGRFPGSGRTGSCCKNAGPGASVQ